MSVLPTVQPGDITNNVHPDDPIQEVTVVGFGSQKAALQLVRADFGLDGLTPTLNTQLKRGQTVSFSKSSLLVLYYRDPQGKSQLLSIFRAHADLHLLIGSCGFQILLSVNTRAPPTTPFKDSRSR